MFEQVKQKLDLLKAPNGFRWELISESHSAAIVKWRNNSNDLKLFYNQKKINTDDQKNFLCDYHLKERIDLVLIDDKTSIPVGVWNIKNISNRPEMGKLIGEQNYRGIGLGSKATHSIIDFWFNVMGQNELFAETLENNLNNIAINERIGFRVIEKKMEDGRCFLIMKLTKVKNETNS